MKKTFYGFQLARSTPSNHRARRLNSSGVALVISLAAVILVTIVILAFFYRATLNRQIAFTSTNQVRVEQMARASLEAVVGEIRQEIADPARNEPTTSPYPYRPKPTGILPVRLGVDDPTDLTNTITKVSGDRIAIRPSGAITGSAVSSNDSSLNGRTVSFDRWFGANGPKLGSQTTLPTWLYVTRGNGITNPPNIADARDPKSPDYVIGRFAFAVYNIGDLLDANVAGYPDGDSQAPFKSSIAYADLSVIPGASAGPLVAWRNAATGLSFSQWASGLAKDGPLGDQDKKALAAARSGHRESALGDNALFSRRDVINNPNTSGSPGLLAHFSRSLNAPSWQPVNPDSSAVFPSGASLTHYRDDGVAEEYDVQVGDPFLQRRFSLAKLAWLTPTGPAADISPNAIKACFGLVWDSSEERWDYYGSSSSLQSSIKTLDQVAAELREPNFFELLKAGILEGSVGLSAMSKTMSAGDPVTKTGNYALENNKDLHLLRIGANIVDCADNNNFPTIVSLEFDGVATEVAGVEDLPYFYSITPVATRQSENYTTNDPPGPSEKLKEMDHIWAPTFLNPHRSPSPSVVSAANTPSEVRADIANGVLNKVGVGTFGSPYLRQDPVKDLSALPPIVIPQTDFENFRTAPQAQTSSTAANRLETVAPYITKDKDAQVFHLFSYRTEYTAGSWPALYYKNDPEFLPTPPNNLQTSIAVSGVGLRLQYTTPSGKLKTYATLGGNEAHADETGINDFGSTMPGRIQVGPPLSTATYRSGILSLSGSRGLYFFAPWDPRTGRLGPSAGTPFWLGHTLYPQPGDIDPNGGRVSLARPYTANIYAYPGYWPTGGISDTDGGDQINMADPDGIVRPADGGIDPGGTDTNPIMHIGDANHPSRPVLLQRPYRSVAELGYVFRDSPWKTLNFFHERSADSALLDLFSIADGPRVTADRTNLNTVRTETLKAILKDTAQESDGSSPLLSDAVTSLASGYQSYAFTDGEPNANTPRNVAQTVNFLSQVAGLDEIKYHRESVTRALANSTQTRTWNLLIDLVAQVGRCPKTATAMDRFLVEGEKRYWLSVAIDRYTGKVVARQLEPVLE